jgi:hypothetical protein
MFLFQGHIVLEEKNSFSYSGVYALKSYTIGQIYYCLRYFAIFFFILIQIK